MQTLEFLSEAVAVLAAAVAVVLLSARLRIPPVVGFLISGVLIGPSGLALVPETEQVEAFAEIGVVLLLFIIGLQLSSAEMRTLGRSFLIGGTLQWALTTGLTMGIVIGFGLPLARALFIGFVVSLSSTAVVLKEAQIGEFSFVLMEVGRTNGLLQGEHFQILLVAAVLTVALTPTLVRIAPAVGTRVAALVRSPGRDEGPTGDQAPSGHVVVVGYGMNGSLLARILEETRIPYPGGGAGPGRRAKRPQRRRAGAVWRCGEEGDLAAGRRRRRQDHRLRDLRLQHRQSLFESGS